MNLALTGGIATGKSTFGHLLRERLDAVWFDADACVHDLLDHDAAIQRAVADAFGPEVREPGGRIRRDVLRDMVFADAGARRRLEAILHPEVRRRWEALARETRDAGRHFVADIPLLYETGAETTFDLVVVVACSPDVQVARLMRDRGIAPATAQAMLASQQPISEKVGKAHRVVWNDGSPAQLATQADLLAATLSAS